MSWYLAKVGQYTLVLVAALTLNFFLPRLMPGSPLRFLAGDEVGTLAPEEVAEFEAAGWLIRVDRQFHWTNQGYGSFDDFLNALASRKRKAIRKERAAAVEGLGIRHLTGSALDDALNAFAWDLGAGDDLHATARYRRDLVRSLGRRVLEQAARVARGESDREATPCHS